MEEFFKAIAITEVILLLIIIVMGLLFYVYDYYHPAVSGRNSLAGKALRRRRKIMTPYKVGKISREKVREAAKRASERLREIEKI